MDKDIETLYERLESLEDFLLRLSVYGPFPLNRDRDAEDHAIRNFRADYPYKSGNPEHWVQNNPT